MAIISADTTEERQRVHAFLDQHLDLAPTAIPSLEMDQYYKPLIPYMAASDGTVIAAALSCRAQIAAGTAMAGAQAAAAKGMGGYTKALDRHSELDLIAVDPAARGQGVATQLLDWLEQRLAAAGVRVWFGNVTPTLKVDNLRQFYRARGFSVTEAGQNLPPLLGLRWVPPGVELPAFFFYKSIHVVSRSVRTADDEHT